jgi:hypothetical protein
MKRSVLLRKIQVKPEQEIVVTLKNEAVCALAQDSGETGTGNCSNFKE